MSGEHDLHLERLDDYLRGAGDDVDAYEDALFARAADGTARELGFVEGVASRVREMAERGTVEPWITSREAEALKARWGDALVVLELRAGSAAPVPMPRDAEIIVTRMPVVLAGVERVDVEVTTADGRPIKTMPDVRFDPADGAVFACCEGDLARKGIGLSVRNRLWSVRGAERRVLCEFVSEGVLSE